MRMNGMVSSAIPKTAPPSENKTMNNGMSIISIALDRCDARTNLRKAAVTAPVFSSTANAPPMNNTKAMIGAASSSMKPRIGAWKIIPAEWRRRGHTPVASRSMISKVPGTTTSRVPTPSTSISAFW